MTLGHLVSFTVGLSLAGVADEKAAVCLQKVMGFLLFFVFVQLLLSACLISVYPEKGHKSRVIFFFMLIVHRTKAKMAVPDKKSGGSGDESSEETVVVLEKSKKTLSTGK